MSTAPSSASAVPDTPVQARFGSGRAVRRVEDASLLVGRGAFTDNDVPADAAYLVFVRSPHAHARIVAIATDAARAVPGVLAVWTGADFAAAGVKPLPRAIGFKRADGKRALAPPQHALAVDVVRYVGEAVVAVVAESRRAARDAAEYVDIRYEILPSVVNVADAMAKKAPRVLADAPDNVAAVARYGSAESTTLAITSSRHVVTLDLDNQRLAPSPLEPRAAVATYDAATQRLTLRVSSQAPTGVRDTVCDVLGLPVERMRVVVGDVGGGFGMKSAPFAEDVVVAFAASRLARSVKWTAERMEEFVAASHGRDLTTHATLALDEDGRILALQVDSVANLGAYATPAGVAIQLLIGPWVSTSVYDVPFVDIRISGVLTHTAPTGPYRGAGRPEAIYIIERLLDAAARKCGIDRVELRRRNLVRPVQMPYRNAMGKTYDTGQFERVLDLALAHADWAGYAGREAASVARGRWRGRGIVCFVEWTGAEIFGEQVTVSVADGAVEIHSATQPMGTSLATTFTQLAVDVFGVAPEKIRLTFGDTDRGTGFGSAGSRSLFVGGSAVHVAAERTVQKGQELAATALEAAATDIEYAAGVFRVAGTDRAIGLFDLAAAQPERRITLVSESRVTEATWPNACHVCEVEIDPETGKVEVDRYWGVNDVGRVVNPLVVAGQLEGGALQGIGQALCEALVHDRTSGQLVTGSFLDYALPRAIDAPRFAMATDEATPSTNNLLGVKGVGELGTIGATPAVVNAVVDALYRARPDVATDALQMPLTAERVWRVLSVPATP